MKQLPELTRLWLENLRVSDWSTLAHLEKLTTLTLKKMDITQEEVRKLQKTRADKNRPPLTVTRQE